MNHQHNRQKSVWKLRLRCLWGKKVRVIMFSETLELEEIYNFKTKLDHVDEIFIKIELIRMIWGSRRSEMKGHWSNWSNWSNCQKSNLLFICQQCQSVVVPNREWEENKEKKRRDSLRLHHHNLLWMRALPEGGRGGVILCLDILDLFPHQVLGSIKKTGVKEKN